METEVFPSLLLMRPESNSDFKCFPTMPTLPGDGWWVKSFSQGRQNERSLLLQSGILLWQPPHFLPFSPLAALLQEVREKFQLTLHIPFPTLQWPHRRCWKWNLREVQLINMLHRATYLDSFANEAPSVLPDCCFLSSFHSCLKKTDLFLRRKGVLFLISSQSKQKIETKLHFGQSKLLRHFTIRYLQRMLKL